MNKKIVHDYTDVFKSELVMGAEFSDLYEFPVIDRCYKIPGKAIPFDTASVTENYDQWIHFYINDCRFERIWNNPKQYLKLLQKFNGVIAPDFSTYRDMPLVMQIWNIYRSRAIGFWLQQNGIDVIPNVRWGDERSYEFAFEGLKPGGTFALSTNGCIQNKADREYFKQGLAKMVEALEPRVIVNYSQTPDDIFGAYRENGILIVPIENYSLTVRRTMR